MPPRLHVPQLLRSSQALELPADAARHVQVLRLQPGDVLRLFDGAGGEWSAQVMQMGRSAVSVRVGDPCAVTPELPCAVTLAVGMPTNERMDTLVEKATELGVAVLQPLVCERSVLRVRGERADRKVAHWRAVAVAASEQCGRATVPRIEPVRSLSVWLGVHAIDAAASVNGWSGVLSLRGDAARLAAALPMGSMPQSAVFLSGPEGGLSSTEEDQARAAGLCPTSLGPRVLRADTAPLAALAWIGLGLEPLEGLR
jgi:16S rRNA (uracil1498-N3)-methyltransferase